MPRFDPQYERYVIQLVWDGELEIDDLGRVWRVAQRHGLKKGGYQVVPVRRRRAEHPLPQGYLQVRAMRDGLRRHAGAHRLVWQYFMGDIPLGLTINHIDGVKDHNWLSNLELATDSEQKLHAHRIGLVRQDGSHNNAARFTEEEVVAIRARRAAGEQLVPIAESYGVAMQTISKIVRGERYPLVDGPQTKDLWVWREGCKDNQGRMLSKELWDQMSERSHA